MGFRVRFYYSLSGCLIGFAAALAFGVHFHNVAASIWAAVSGMVALLLACEHYFRKHARSDESEKPSSDHYGYMLIGGTVGVLAGVGGFIAHITIAASHHEKLTGKSNYCASVFAFMTFKWSLSMLIHARRYFTHTEEGPLGYRVKVAYSAFGGLVGVSAFCVFGIVHHAWAAAAWGWASGTVAFVLMFEHMYRHGCDRRGDLPHRHLGALSAFGVLACVGGFAGAVTYCCLAAVDREKLDLQSRWIAAVWAAMTLKWGFSVLWNSSYFADADSKRGEKTPLLGAGNVNFS